MVGRPDRPHARRRAAAARCLGYALINELLYRDLAPKIRPATSQEIADFRV
jgi:hypothetical protein